MMEFMCSINWEYFIAIISIFASFIISILAILSTKGNAQKERLIDIVTSNRMDWIQKYKDYMATYLGMIYFYYEKVLPEDTSKFITELHELSFKIKLHLNFKGKVDQLIFTLIDDINTAFEKLFMYRSAVNNKQGEIFQNTDFFSYIEKIQYQFPGLYKDLYRKILKECGINIIDDSNDEIEHKLDSIGVDKFQEFMKQLVIISDNDLKKSSRIIKYGHRQLQIISQVYLKTEWERVKIEARAGSLNKFNFDEIFDSLISEKQFELDQWEKLKEK